jgi:D-ribose pyranose/furanose isomerase RbsD
MNETEIQDALMNVIESLIDAREEIEGDDDITLADLARDMVDEMQEVIHATTFERAQLLTSNQGLVLRTGDGSEFQISIVRSR